MTLATLRQLVRDLVNDQTGTEFAEATVTRAINGAYEDVAAIVDDSPEPQNIAAPVLVTRAIGVREVATALPGSLARIADVVEYNETDGTEGPRRDVIPWAQRNDGANTGQEVYFFVRAAVVGSVMGRAWYMGGTGIPTESPDVVRVYATIGFDDLVNENDVPWYVPGRYHSLIATKAAILLLDPVKRDLGSLPALWMERRGNLERYLTNRTKPGSHRRMTPM